MRDPENCRCRKPPFFFLDYRSVLFGVDMTNDRYGDITIDTCRHCGTKWITYLYEYPFFTNGGRYYKGIVTDEKLEELTPGTAAEYLESLEWYFYGGSFFDTTGKIGSGPLTF